MVKKERHPGDPRPDFVTDHRHWEQLLWNSWHTDQALYYLLHGIRCGGGEVIRTQNGYRLMSGEWNEAEWEEIKQTKLSPFRDKLVNIFKLTRIGKYLDEKLPDEFLRK